MKQYPLLYVISDIHLGVGIDEHSQRYSRLEGFFYDDEFCDFVDFIIEDASDEDAILIINGDLFDFISVEKLPTKAEREKLKILVSNYEKKFGLLPSRKKALWKVEKIMRGHKKFFLALLKWIKKGKKIVIIRGNHDLELFFDSVQHRVLELLSEFSDNELSIDELKEKVEFKDWFYYEKDRVYIEHGNQYEASNANLYNLYPIFPYKMFGLREQILDYPIGSYFLQIVYNRLRLIDPYTTKLVSYEEYVRLFDKNRLLDSLKIMYHYIPFMAKMLKEFQSIEKFKKRELREKQNQKLEQLSKETGLGDKIYKLDSLKEYPVSKTKYQLSAAMLIPVIKKMIFIVLAVIFGVLIFNLTYSLILGGHFLSNYPVFKAILTSVISLGLFGIAFFLVIYISRKLNTETYEEEKHFRGYAEKIMQITGVKVVSFGHTHTPDFYHNRRYDAYYVNTGTWSFGMYKADVIKPQSLLFPYLKIVGDKPHLYKWNPCRKQPEQPLLLSWYRQTFMERILTREDKNE